MHLRIPRRVSRRPAVAIRAVVLAGLAFVVGGCSILPASSAERAARKDAATVGEAVAGFVTSNGRLPRVRVVEDRAANGDMLWGEYFLVESQAVPRADASRARLFFVVGDPGRWCVEMLYNPRATLSDSSPSKWVSARAEGGAMSGVRDGRCGEGFDLVLSPMLSTDVPDPGTMVDAASAPVGTCLSGLLGDGRSTGPVEVVGCGDPHFAEIYHGGEIVESAYSRFQESAAATCADAFEDFVGVPHNMSALVGEPFTADESQWRAGSGRYSCVLFLGFGGYSLVGSARDSWR